MRNSDSLPWANTVNRYDVSIVVPTFNRAHYIEECLDSLINQTQPAIEIIVVDDGSNDDTAVRVRQYGDKIKYIWKDNEGKAAALNLALPLVQGNLVWLFDDDDVARPQAIELRVAALKKMPEAGFVYTPYLWGTDGADGKIITGRLNNCLYFDGDTLFAEVLKSCFFSLNSALVRKEAFRLAGEFNVSLIRSQDYDMLIRLTRIVTATYSPHPSFIVRQHAGDRGSKANRSAGNARGKTFQKYDNHVGQEIRKTVSLGEFLVPRVDHVLTPDQTRQALLARMVVMASKACISGMFEDLKSALATLTPGEALTSNDSNLIASSVCIGYAYAAIEANFSAFKQFIREIPNDAIGKQARRSLAKGFFRLAKSYPGTLRERTRKLIVSAMIWTI